jgi:RHS repeat-associated protein
LKKKKYLNKKLLSLEPDIKTKMGCLKLTYCENYTVLKVVQQLFFSTENTCAIGYRYKFSAKELDQETGYSYFGARYYIPEVSIWGSADPLMDKYPNISPYNYCAWNPIRFIDPDGREIWITGEDGQRIKYTQGMKYEGTDVYTGKAVASLNEIGNTKSGGVMVKELSDSKNIFDIKNGSKSNFEASNKPKASLNQLKSDPNQASSYDALQKMGVDLSGGSGGTITWNFNGTELTTTRGNQSNSTTDLAHELFHGLDANRGLLDNRTYKHNEMSRSEWQACYRENVLRQEMGVPLRTYYRTQRNYDGSVEGVIPRILTGGNKPLLPPWYKP